jgi:hypothetical protein
MADTSDGFIYGLDAVKWNGELIGYLDENGLAAGGDAPSTTKVRAAQRHNAVVKNLLTTPGSKTFTGTLIQLLLDNIKDVFGGTIDGETGVYSAPEVESLQEGNLQIDCASGHKIVAPKVSLTANFAQSINLAQTLAIGLTFEILEPDGGGSSYDIYPPGAEIGEG